MSGSVGRYREIAVIGQGGMAIVKLAALPGPLGIQKLLVVKEALPHLASDPEFVAMFTAEARLAARFDHPNLIQTYEVGEEAGRYFIVMEYVDGQPYHTLASRLKRQVPLGVALRILTRVLSGLHYAHELKDLQDRPLEVVHRDVSPQNVFVCYSGVTKLADFGIAKVADAAIKTRVGQFKGKLAYASPEQIAGEAVDRRSDIYSVGIMLWEALVQRRITHGVGEAAIIQRRLQGQELRVLAEKPDAPPELAEICDKAMAPEAEDRFATAAQMQEAIEAYMAKAGIKVTDEEVGALVSQTFEEERTGLRRIIQDRLAAATTDAGQAPLPLALHERSSPSHASTGGRAPSTDAVATVAAPLELTRGGFARSKAALWGAGVAIFALVLGGGLIVRHRVAFEAPSPPLASASAGAESSVDVFLAVEPRSAQMSLDDAPLTGNPFQGRHSVDHTAHTLKVTAAGYVPEERAVSLERDVHIELALRPVASASASASAPAAKQAPRGQSRDDVQSGGLRFQGGRKANPIDNENPYGSGP